MTRKERKELASDIEDRLDNELDFELEYEISDYHQCNTSVVDVDIELSEDYPDDWDCQVEDIIAAVAEEWGGWYSWEGWCISVSVSDD